MLLSLCRRLLSGSLPHWLFSVLPLSSGLVALASLVSCLLVPCFLRLLPSCLVPWPSRSLAPVALWTSLPLALLLSCPFRSRPVATSPSGFLLSCTVAFLPSGLQALWLSGPLALPPSRSLALLASCPLACWPSCRLALLTNGPLALLSLSLSGALALLLLLAPLPCCLLALLPPCPFSLLLSCPLAPWRLGLWPLIFELLIFLFLCDML